MYVFKKKKKRDEEGLIMELKILELSASHAFGAREVEKTDSYISVIDEYELDSTDLSNYNVLMINYFVDQEYLYKHKQIIENFLNEGKVVGIGTHKELIKNCDVYREIALSQLSEEEINNG